MVVLILAGIVLWVFFGILWWVKVYNSPERIFNDMLVNNFSAKSVLKTQVNENDQGSLKQNIEMTFGEQAASRWLVTIKQKGGTEVSTESIGTPKAGYVRYEGIETKNKNKAGKMYNFSSVLNVWGKSDGSKSAVDNLYAQAILDVRSAPLPLVGKLSESERQNLLGFIKDNKVFMVDFKKVEHKTIDGKQVLIFPVKVNLFEYARLAKEFAASQNLHDLDDLDPNSFNRSSPPEIKLTIDRTSRHLAKAAYPKGNYEETFTNWGRVKPIKIPSKTIPVSQLEARLKKLQ